MGQKCRKFADIGRIDHCARPACFFSSGPHDHKFIRMRTTRYFANNIEVLPGELKQAYTLTTATSSVRWSGRNSRQNNPDWLASKRTNKQTTNKLNDCLIDWLTACLKEWPTYSLTYWRTN
jgi:hypothetical protein